MKDAAAPGDAYPFIFVRSERRIEKIELRDILYIESMGNYASICTETKKITALEGNGLRLGTKVLPIGRNYKDPVMNIIQQRMLKR